MSTAARILNARILARYSKAPRRFRFAVFGTMQPPPKAGEVITISHRLLQDAEGNSIAVPAIITSVKPTRDHYAITAEEFTWAQPWGSVVDELIGSRILSISANTIGDPWTGGSLNLRTVHDRNHPAPDSSSNVTFIIEEGVTVGAPNATLRALDVGSWPTGCTVKLIIRPGAAIIGAGGRGGRGSDVLFGDSVEDNPAWIRLRTGEDGGVGLYTRFPITVENYGLIAGGGGGGGAGAAGGVGGAPGRVPNVEFAPVAIPGTAGTSGSVTKVGKGGVGANTTNNVARGGNGGNGGYLGQPGEDGTSGFGTSTGPVGLGGAAGVAIDGASYITMAVAGAVFGATVN